MRHSDIFKEKVEAFKFQGQLFEIEECYPPNIRMADIRQISAIPKSGLKRISHFQIIIPRF